MENREIPKYSGSQQELWEIARIAWKNYYNSLPKFTAFSPRYTEVFGATRMAEIDAAELLPSDNNRSSLSEDNRILLTRSADNCLNKWQNLKRYVVEAYDEERSLTMLKSAGQPNYNDAAHYKWKSIKTLMNEGAGFIKTHLADLIAKDNMPPDFAIVFDAAKEEYDSLQGRFFTSVAAGSTNTQIKIMANNEVYSKLMKMLQDAQLIFVDDESAKQQFVYNNIKAIVSGTNQAGIRGFVTDAGTGLPVGSATVATANNVAVATTDNEGHYNLKLSAADYQLTVGATGYVSQAIALTVKIGTVSSLDVSLVIV